MMTANRRALIKTALFMAFLVIAIAIGSVWTAFVGYLSLAFLAAVCFFGVYMLFLGYEELTETFKE